HDPSCADTRTAGAGGVTLHSTDRAGMKSDPPVCNSVQSKVWPVSSKRGDHPEGAGFRLSRECRRGPPSGYRNPEGPMQDRGRNLMNRRNQAGKAVSVLGKRGVGLGLALGLAGLLGLASLTRGRGEAPTAAKGTAPASSLARVQMTVRG